MSVSRSLNMTQSGRMQKPGQAPKQTNAEMLLKQKYDSTIAMKSVADGQDQESLDSKAKKRRALKAYSLLLDDQDSKTSDSRKLRPSATIQIGAVDVNLNRTTNVNINEVETINEDFLQTKFGVSKPKSKTSRQINKNLSQTVDSISFKQEQSQGPSITQKIFVEESKQQALLPVETENIDQSAVVRKEQEVSSSKRGKRLSSRVLRPGFSGYVEQEQLDKAGINDLLASEAKAVVPYHKTEENEQLRIISHQSSVKGSLNHHSLQSVNSEKMSVIQTPPNKMSEAKDFGQDSQDNGQQQALSIVQYPSERLIGTANPVIGVKRKSVEEHVPSEDAIQTQDKNQNKSKQALFDTTPNHQKESEDQVSVLQGGIPPTEMTQEQPKVQKETRFEDSPPPIQPQSKEAQEDLLAQNSVERPLSQSSMGRFVADILHHDGRYAQKQPEQISATYQIQPPAKARQGKTRNQAVSKSIDVGAMKHTKLPAVINQDSVLIKHDFDAGQSKVWQTHMMTQKAHFRMQQLIALLRHKTGSQIPAGGADDPFDFEENDQVIVEAHELSDGVDMNDGSMMRQSHQSNDETADEQNLKRIVSVMNADNDTLPSLDRSKLDRRGAMEQQHEFVGDSRRISLPTDDVETTQAQWNTERDLLNKNPTDFSSIENQIRVNIDKFKPQRAADADNQAITEEDQPNQSMKNYVVGANAFENEDYRNKRYERDVVERDLFGAKDGNLNMSEMGMFGDADSFLNKIQNFDSKAKNEAVRSSRHHRNQKNTLNISAMRLKALAQPKRNIINTEYLTLVPKRGRMIDTQQYIRENLQAYADNKNFGFTKAQAINDQKQNQFPLSPQAKTRTIIVGNPIHTMENKRFLNPIIEKVQQPDTSLLQAKKDKRKALMTLEYEPIIAAKKPQLKTIRVKRSRRLGQSIDTARRANDQEQESEVIPKTEVEVLYDENQDLRHQIVNMVDVFEQYLKVATLKESAERMQGKSSGQCDDETVNGGLVPQSVQDSDQYKPVMDMNSTSVPFIPQDSKLQLYESLHSEDRLSQHTPKQKARRRKRDAKSVVVNKSLDPASSAQYQLDSNRDFFKQNLSSVREEGGINRQYNHLKYLKLEKIQHMNHVMPYIKSPLNQTSSKNLMAQMRSSSSQLLHAPIESKQVTFRGGSKPLRSSSISNFSLPGIINSNLNWPSRYGTMVLHNQSEISILAASEHRTHNQWLVKINAVWEKMEKSCNLKDVIRIEEQIRANKKSIKMLKIENMKGNARCLALDVKLIKKSKNNKATRAEKIQKKFIVKLIKVQQRIKVCMDQSAEFNIWGFNSHIIAHVVKCRLLEDLVHCAQKRQIRPDEEVERELRLMKMLQKQTWEDINNFLKNRNQDKWRSWDNPRNLNYNKTAVPGFNEAASDNKTINFEFLQQSSEENKAISFWTSKLTLLGQDLDTHVLIAREMVQFVNHIFGNSAWLTLTRIKALRKLNKEKTVEIEQELVALEESKRPKAEALNWLQLVPGNKDMTIIGPEPTWMKHIKPQPSKMESTSEIANEASEDGRQASSILSTKLLAVGSVTNTFKSSYGTVSNTGFPTAAQTRQPSATKRVVPILHLESLSMRTSRTKFEKPEGAADNETDKKSYEKQKQEVTFNVDSEGSDRDQKVESVAEGDSKTPAADSAGKQETSGNSKWEKVREAAGKQKFAEKSKWQKIIEKEKQQADQRKKEQDEARAKRLAHLFKDEESEDEDMMAKHLDLGAAQTDIHNLLDKVDVHLQVEMNILKKWQDKDNKKSQTKDMMEQSQVSFIPAGGQMSPMKQAPFGMNQTSQPNLSNKWSNSNLNQNSERSERSASIRKSHEKAMEENKLKRQSSSIGKFNSFMQKIKGKNKSRRQNSNESLNSMKSQDSLLQRSITENFNLKQQDSGVFFRTISPQKFSPATSIKEEEEQPLRIVNENQIFIK